MAYTVHQIPGLVCFRMTGVVLLDDLIGLGRDIEVVERKAEILPHRVVDLSLATGDQTDFAAIAAFAKKRSTKVLKNEVRLAIIAISDLHFGIARTFQSLVANPMIEIRIFRDSSQAWTWLEMPCPYG
jgi:hypothetical protein